MAGDDPTRTIALTAAGTAVGLLVDGADEALERLTQGRHVSAAELRRTVSSLGVSLAPTPARVWAGVDLVPVRGAEPAAYEVTVPLWTASGPAGLGLSLRLVATPWDTFEVEVTGTTAVAAAAPAPAAAVGVSRGPDAAPDGDPVPARWRPALAAAVHRLVVADAGGRGADADLRRWVDAYPATLVDLPPEAWAWSDHGPVDGAPGTWWVVVDLWTAEEGRSDLSLEATVRDDGAGVEVAVESVHVL